MRRKRLLILSASVSLVLLIAGTFLLAACAKPAPAPAPAPAPKEAYNWKYASIFPKGSAWHMAVDKPFADNLATPRYGRIWVIKELILIRL